VIRRHERDPFTEAQWRVLDRIDAFLHVGCEREDSYAHPLEREKDPLLLVWRRPFPTANVWCFPQGALAFDDVRHLYAMVATYGLGAPQIWGPHYVVHLRLYEDGTVEANDGSSDGLEKFFQLITTEMIAWQQ